MENRMKTWIAEIKFNGQTILATLEEKNNMEIKIYDPIDFIIGNCTYYTPDNLATYIKRRV